jgi:hypothetical protein
MTVTINGSSGLTANDGSVFTTAAGLVGIGTSSPTAKLDVVGSVDATTVAAAGNGMRIRTPSGSGSPAILQFTNNPVTAQWAFISATAQDVLNINDRTYIDASGRMTTPGQPLYVGVERAGVLSSTTYTTWVHSITRINAGSNMNTSTGIFTCPVAGRYLVAFNVLARANGSHNIQVQKNGSMWASGRDITPSGEQCSGVVTVVDCAVNDQLRIQVQCDPAADFWLEWNQTTIMLIS